MREMWVDPKYFNRRSFGCYQAPKDMIPGVDDILNAIPVVVMTKVEFLTLKTGYEIAKEILEKSKEETDGTESL